MANKRDTSLSSIKMGMNKDAHIDSLKEEEYTHAKNSNIISGEGDKYYIQNEQSNILASTYKKGFKVIGVKEDPNSDTVYYFLTNPTTGQSEIGFIEGRYEEINLHDLEICEEGQKKTKLSPPLEDITYEEIQEYKTLISDCQENGYCLNFDIQNPIKSIEISEEKCGTVIYFTDGVNPPRYIEVDKIEQYLTEGGQTCGTEGTQTCLDCEKLKMFKRQIVPTIQPETLINGGNLEKGTYEFLMAYCSETGKEKSRYFSITNKIPIFENNTTEETNKGIKVSISKRDSKEEYYKIAVIYVSDKDKSTSIFEDNIYPIGNEEIVYTTNKNRNRIDFQTILREAVRVDKWETLSTANNYMFGSGIKYKRDINLQPVVNLLTPFVNWQTHIASEDLYKDGVMASKYKGYYRGETYPLGIRFKVGGDYTKNFPLIGRKKNVYDNEVIYNKDKDSIKGQNIGCEESAIERRWQLYDTSKSFGKLRDKCQTQDKIRFSTIYETEEKRCTGEIRVLHGGKFNININEEEDFIDLITYLEDNKYTLIQNSKDQTSTGTLYEIGRMLDAETHEDCLVDFSDLCDGTDCCQPVEGIKQGEGEVFVDEDTILQEGNVTIEKTEVEFPEGYIKLKSPKNSYILEKNAEGKTSYDEDFEEDFIWTNKQIRVAHRSTENFGGGCGESEEIQTITSTNNFIISQNIGYSGSYNVNNLLSNKYSANGPITYTGGSVKGSGALSYISIGQLDFHEKINRDAIWLKKDVSTQHRQGFILDITKRDENSIEDRDLARAITGVRVNIFRTCSDTQAQYSRLVNITEGEMFKFEIDEEGLLSITDGQGNTVSDIFEVYGGELYIVIESPIKSAKSKAGETSYITTPTGAFGVAARSLQYSDVYVEFDKIGFYKELIYLSECEYQVPYIDGCETAPWEFGEFSYTESEETYPDNKELYDSSKIKIREEDFPEGDYYEGKTYKEIFKDYFNPSIEEGRYVVGEVGNLTCKKIRHFKFPGNEIAPFMWESRLPSFSETMVFPLGVYIDKEIVETILKTAVENKLITEEERREITGYEVVRGDRNGNETIVSKGILFDTYKYKERNLDVFYPNYPLNSLGDDILNYKDSDRKDYIPHPYQSQSHNTWTYTSLESESREIGEPALIDFEGYLYGKSKHRIDEVKEHPKWVILGKKLKRLASTLATAEIISEMAVIIARSAEAYRVQIGLSNSANPVGIGLSIGLTAFQAISNSLFKYQRYKTQWIESFTNLGRPINFAYYSTGVSTLNYFKTNREEGNKIRYAQLVKKLGKGSYEAVNRVSGESTVINNIDRDPTTLIQVGEEWNIEYTDRFKGYDNTSEAIGSSSKVIEANSGIRSTGMSPEVYKNAANMYVSLKNYNNRQYGGIDNIKWLTTGHSVDFEDKKCKDFVFGGDIYISRTYHLRRMPLFLTTSMGQADLTPFEYKFYNNIGEEPRFYVNYKTESKDPSVTRPVPDVDSEFSLDSFSGHSGRYVKEPSKFYLYMNGIAGYLTESTINSNFRFSKKELWEDFYPNVGDYMAWTQEVDHPIRRAVPFFYNNIYSLPNTAVKIDMFPSNYKREEYECRHNMPNGVMYSLPKSDENVQDNPWLIYRPNDVYEAPTNYGKLINLKEIETAQVLGRFENTSIIFNAVDEITDTGQSPDAGTGGIFLRRPRTFSNTSLGYAGSQTHQMISTQHGHFFLDAKRGQVFMLAPGGKNLVEISANIGDRPSNMREWFKNNLPFKILRYYPAIDIDNPYNGVGITMGWDNRNHRLFITKKDYIPKTNDMLYEKGFFYDDSEEAIQSILDNKEEGWEFKEVRGNKVVFTREEEISNRKCLEKLRFVVEYRRNPDSGIPCPSNHYCNRAVFNFIVNGVDVGQVSLNNAGGEYDLQNMPPNYSTTDPLYSQYDRYSEIVLTEGQIDAILQQSDLLNINLECACVNGDNCESNGCHQEVSWVKVYLDDNLVYSDCPKDQIIKELDVCKDYKETITVEEEVHLPIIPYSNKKVFKDVSWTISFNLDTRGWASFFDFKPNYYVTKHQYFQTGVNTTDDTEEFGLWSHLLTDQSFQVFYGKAYKWEVEAPVTNKQYQRYLESLSYSLESLRYTDDNYNYYKNNEIGFDEVIIFNNDNNSGKLCLDLQKTLKQLTQYPITEEGQQRILQTFQDNEYRFNYFYNRVKNNQSGLPILIKDDNQIDKIVNSDIVGFKGKRILERLRGNVFLVNFKSKETQHKKILKYLKINSNIYDK